LIDLKQSFEDSHGIYDSPRIHHDIREAGTHWDNAGRASYEPDATQISTRTTSDRTKYKLLLHFSLNFLYSDMAHITSLDHVDHIFRDVLGMVTYTLNGLGDKQDFQRVGYCTRVFHHESDKVTHYQAEALAQSIQCNNTSFGKLQNN
jgi:hypothetical protein